MQFAEVSERDESTRLTRLPDELVPGAGNLSRDWQPINDALYAELAPASLADRILAEGILALACRVWHLAYDQGYSAGTDGAFDDCLNWIDHATQERRGLPQSNGWTVLAELRGTVQRNRDLGEVAR